MTHKEALHYVGANLQTVLTLGKNGKEPLNLGDIQKLGWILKAMLAKAQGDREVRKVLDKPKSA